jgi:hypothetical protein
MNGERAGVPPNHGSGEVFNLIAIWIGWRGGGVCWFGASFILLSAWIPISHCTLLTSSLESTPIASGLGLASCQKIRFFFPFRYELEGTARFLRWGVFIYIYIFGDDMAV